MEYKITSAQLGTRPNVQLPDSKILEFLGEEGMRELISQHYDLLRVSKIKDLFPKSEKAFEKAKEHSADFFIQICGGPAYFNQKRGRPMMAARHTPFKITQEARKIWLESYAVVLEKSSLPEDLKKSFWNYLDIFSIWMMNSEG